MSHQHLGEENEALRIKVNALEEELKRCHAECVGLRNELQSLTEIRNENDRQRRLIETLREELEHARTGHISAVEALNVMEKNTRNTEHWQRMDRVRAALSTGEKGSVSSGTEIICKGSNISSIGFAPVQRPFDFLGGIHREFHGRTADMMGETDEEVSQIMSMARDSAFLDVKHAEVCDVEEKELLDRYNALRQWKPK